MNSINIVFNRLVNYFTSQIQSSTQYGGDQRSIINIDMDEFKNLIDMVSKFKKDWSKSFRLFDRYDDKMPYDDKVNSYADYEIIKSRITKWLNEATIGVEGTDTETVFGKDIIERMENEESNHGFIFFDPNGSRKMSLYEHTIDALLGICSGTGISLLTTLNNDYLNKLMIIAIVYHDSGKITCEHSGHDLISCKIVDDEILLTKHEKSIIKDALTHKNEFYNTYKTIHRMVEEIKLQMSSYVNKYDMDINVAFRFVFSLFLADSTTLYSVYTGHGNKSYFDDYHERINELTIEDDLENIIKRFNYRRPSF